MNGKLMNGKLMNGKLMSGIFMNGRKKRNILMAGTAMILALTLQACGNGRGAEAAEKVPTDAASAETIPGDAASYETEKKVLVAYFSCTGTTENAAEYAAELLGADLFRIQAEDPYTGGDLDYTDSTSRSSIEQGDDTVRPAVSGSVEEMERYDVIYLGYPIWHGQAPRILNTFLESYDFSEKTIIPFCTSGGSGIGQSAESLKKSCPGSTVWYEGVRFGSGTSQAEISEWIDGLSLPDAAD